MLSTKKLSPTPHEVSGLIVHLCRAYDDVRPSTSGLLSQVCEAHADGRPELECVA